MEQPPVKGYISNRKIIIVVIVLVVLYFGWGLVNSFMGVNLRSFSTSVPKTASYGTTYDTSGSGGVELAPPSGFSELADTTTTVTNTSQARMVISTSNLSLLVKDVKDAGDKVLNFANEKGGYMVATSYNRPTESPFATITVRIPSGKFDEALNYFRSLAIKVSNENLQGRDVTDQYVNIEERLSTLTKTKTRLQSIMEMTNDVTEIIKVQKEIINLQSQIDSLVGQQKALEQEVAMTKITVYLSTDELSLPYTPDTKFRPQVIFKLAVRSLLNSLRSIGELLIWVTVYGVIWVPAIIIYKLIKRWRNKKRIPSSVGK
jgi:Domain of unknown function (DUF4349)